MFTIAEIPQHDFMISCTAVRLDQFTSLKSALSIHLFGWRNNAAMAIQSHKIRSIARSNVNDFNFIFKAVEGKYEKLVVKFSVDNGQVYLINFGI